MIKQFVFRQFVKNETRLHELNYLFWECTTRCNLNCRHCGSDCSNDSYYKDMPLGDFLAALDTIEKKSPDLMVVLTGGEPLLRKDIEICGREIRKRSVRWSMVSNGYFYDEKKHVSLLNAGLGALTFSFDGLENTHNWLRGNDKSFERVDNAISLAVSSPRLYFDVVTCVNNRSYNELKQIRDYLISKKVKSWRLFTITPIGRAKGDPEMYLTDLQFKELMDFICESRKLNEIDVKFSCEGFVGQYEWKVRDAGFFCRAGINIGSILIDGSISACPNIDRSFAQGNIYRDNFHEIWQTKYELFRNREWTRTGKCEKCKSYKNCRGNGFHYRHNGETDVLVCHNEKIENVVNSYM